MAAEGQASQQTAAGPSTGRALSIRQGGGDLAHQGPAKWRPPRGGACGSGHVRRARARMGVRWHGGQQRGGAASANGTQRTPRMCTPLPHFSLACTVHCSFKSPLCILASGSTLNAQALLQVGANFCSRPGFLDSSGVSCWRAISSFSAVSGFLCEMVWCCGVVCFVKRWCPWLFL